MNFSKPYKLIKPSVVAICGKISSNPQFPDIIGTGVIVDESGLILTNSHVVKAISRLPRSKTAPPEEWPAFCFLFNFIPEKGMATIPLDIVGVAGIEAYSANNNYGDLPDIGFIRVNVTNLPCAKIAEKFVLEEGEEIGIAGFPMGTNTLRAPGWIHQFGPTLKVAHVGATLPFVCDNPHAILIDSIMQGGNSGSPVFNESGEIVAILYGGLNDIQQIKIPLKDGKMGGLRYTVPTNISYAVPSQIIHLAIQEIKQTPAYNEKIDTLTLEQHIERLRAKVMGPKTSNMYDERISENDIQRLVKEHK